MSAQFTPGFLVPSEVAATWLAANGWEVFFIKKWDTDNLSLPITALKLSTRPTQTLQNANVKLVGELAQLTEQQLIRYKNFGRKSLAEVKEALKRLDLALGMTLKDWSNLPIEVGADHVPAPIKGKLYDLHALACIYGCSDREMLERITAEVKP